MHKIRYTFMDSFVITVTSGPMSSYLRTSEGFIYFMHLIIRRGDYTFISMV